MVRYQSRHAQESEGAIDLRSSIALFFGLTLTISSWGSIASVDQSSQCPQCSRSSQSMPKRMIVLPSVSRFRTPAGETNLLHLYAAVTALQKLSRSTGGLLDLIISLVTSACEPQRSRHSNHQEQVLRPLTTEPFFSTVSKGCRCRHSSSFRNAMYLLQSTFRNSLLLSTMFMSPYAPVGGLSIRQNSFQNLRFTCTFRWRHTHRPTLAKPHQISPDHSKHFSPTSKMHEPIVISQERCNVTLPAPNPRAVLTPSPQP